MRGRVCVSEYIRDLSVCVCVCVCVCVWGRAGGSRGRELCGRHIWARHRLRAAIGCLPYAAACQQDGLPPPAVLTLIILVSPENITVKSSRPLLER